MATICTLFGDIQSTGTSLSIRLCLFTFCSSSFVDWPSVFTMFPCTANCIVCCLTFLYIMVNFSNLFDAKRCTGTSLSFTFCLTILSSKLQILQTFCNPQDDLLLLVPVSCPFAYTVSILPSNFSPIPITFHAGQGSEMSFSQIDFSSNFADLKQVSFDLSFLAPFLSLELPFCFQS